MKTRSMILVAMFAAITAVMAQISIPIPVSPVPITMQVFAVSLAAGILGAKLGSISMGIYNLLGIIGVPVFAQGKAGLMVIFGPTGGYLWSYVIAAYVIGRLMENKDGKSSYANTLLAMVAGMLIIYLCGTVQLAYVMKLNLTQALIFGVGWFLPFDAVKLFLAAGVSHSVRKALIASGYIVQET